ncbi:MAG: hypothetical protein ACXVIJ_04545 [Thermoanaerobaculia bacterium]
MTMTGRERLSPAHALLDVVVLAFLCGLLVAIWLVFRHDAWRYYTTSVATRGYSAPHRFLRPSGMGGHTLGVVGTLFLFGTLPYLARKRWKRLSKVGTVPGWLQAHIFCGVFGPILITFHSSFKFNGVISVAYWSMALVVGSGFVGRSLYIRIPKTIRGEELSNAQIEARLADLKLRLNDAALPPPVIARLKDADAALVENLKSGSSFRRAYAATREFRRRSSALRRELRGAHINRDLIDEVLDLAEERAVLLRRIARLKRTRELFQVWHVFHRPLVWVMFLIFFVHLGVALYFGYVPFMGE